MQHTITEHYIEYYPQKLSYEPLNENYDFNKGFIIKLKLKKLPNTFEKTTVLKIGGVLKINTGIYRFPEAFENISDYEKSECYNVYTDKNGCSPYIEAVITLYKDTEDKNPHEMSIGLPLNLFDAVNNDIYLYYDNAHFMWLVNGEIANRNFPIGILKSENNIFISENITANINYSPECLEFSQKSEIKNRSIAFYSARGYNEWAGDIVNFFHNGVYHYLVLLDRHHHGNRFGGGAHSTYHMTTKDFIHWDNYGEIYPIKHSFETFGTGTMFYFDQKYYYSHGLHTTRMIPYEKTGSKLLKENFEHTHTFNAVPYSVLKANGLLPSGANYLVSDDGIHFASGNKQIHCSENPSIYADKNGKLIMYAGYGSDGVWQSESIDGPWEKAHTDMPIKPCSSPVNNSTECPSIFEWNGYKYIIMGFKGYWQSEYQSDKFIDLAAKGEDIYDGLCVPMVACCNGRYIISGWVGGYGWAFVTQHRELIQESNGKLGIRWMPELTPNTNELKCLKNIKSVKNGDNFKLESKTSYYIDCTVLPKSNGRVGISLCGSGKPCIFELNTERKKVQMSETNCVEEFAPEIKALYEYIPQPPDNNIHTNSYDFSIANVRQLENKYKLKIILHYEKKTDSLILDAEIGGARTFISNRRYFKAENLKFLIENANIYDLKIYKLED